MILLADRVPPAEEGWWTLFELAQADSETWTLIGGQMMQLLAAEYGYRDVVRPTADLDVVIDLRMRPGGTEWVSAWLEERGYRFEGANPDNVGHRFSRTLPDNRGHTYFDVLAPEGLGERTNTRTMPPARTVQAPGSTQALARSELVEVTVSGMVSNAERVGRVRRPTLHGALVLKAATTTISGRVNPDRDWQDAALLLAMLPAPLDVKQACNGKDRERLARLEPLTDDTHAGWMPLDAPSRRQGRAALHLLLR